MKGTKRIIMLLLVVSLVMGLMLTACGQTPQEEEPAETPSEETPSETPEDTEPDNEAAQSDLRFGYICKMLTNPWFIQEEWGIKQKCEELGIEYVGVDANLEDEQCMAAVDNLIAKEIDAIIICATNQGLGPAIAQKCEEAGVALITIDDSMVDHNGKPIPHVGLPTMECGMLGGEALGKLAKERGFFEEGNVVKVMNIDLTTLSVTHERTLGYIEALKKECPELKDEDFIVQDTKDGMFESSLTTATAILNAHPEATHWIITGINDDGALAGLKVMEENNFNMDNVLACGLGGYELSLEEFKKGNSSYICIALEAHVEGMKAVEILYDYIVNGTEMPEATLVGGQIATVDNYLDFFPNGKMVHQQ